MTTSESKGRFFLQNESIRIDSNRELECSTAKRLAFISLRACHAHTAAIVRRLSALSILCTSLSIFRKATFVLPLRTKNVLESPVIS